MNRGSRPLGLLVALSTLLAVAGNLLGNPVANLVSAPYSQYALLALGLVALAAMAIGIRLAQLQNGSASHSRQRQRTTVLLIVLDGVLATVAGVLSNVASAELPQDLQPWSLPFLLVVLVLAIGVAVLLYKLQNTPRVQGTNRRRFLSKLQTRYSQRQDDVLREAVQRLVLELQEIPEAVIQPTLATDISTNRTNYMTPTLPVSDRTQTSPAGTTISTVYDAAGGQVLLLGEPGAGKSMLLVELGIELLKRARADMQYPMPVLFNLGSWATDHSPLSEWLVDELENSYQVPESVAQMWIDQLEILPLLDGLDEVAPAQRPHCVAAINTFHAAHPTLPLVVACQRRRRNDPGVTEKRDPPLVGVSWVNFGRHEQRVRSADEN